MEITSVQVNLTPEAILEKDRIYAFVRIVIDDSFAIKDIKVQQSEGYLRLAMPSRRIHEPCPTCRKKVDPIPPYCPWCKAELNLSLRSDRRNHADIVYPVTRSARRVIEAAVLEAYNVKVSPDKQLKLRTFDA